VSDADKADLRRGVLEGLADASSRVRTAVATAVAAIAEWDWPEQWPELMPALIGVIQSKPDASAVQGAVGCLSVVCEDLDDVALPQLMAALLPEMTGIAGGGGGHADATRREALVVTTHMLRTLGHMGGREQRELRDAVAEQAAALLGVVTGVVGAPMTDDAENWALRGAALDAAVTAVPLFASSGAARGALPGLVEAARGMYVQCAPAFESAVVAEDADPGALASEDGVGLETLVCQASEVLLTFLGSDRLRPALEPYCEQLAYVTGTYVQMTAAQAEEWAVDPAPLLGNDSDDFSSARATGEMFLEEVAAQWKERGVEAVVGAYLQLQRDAEGLAREGNLFMAGRRREAAITAVGAVVDRLASLWKRGRGQSLTAERLTEELMARDLTQQTLEAAPFVACRALWLLARLGRRLPAAAVPRAVEVAASGLDAASPAPLQFASMRALSALVPLCDPAVVAPLLGRLYPALGHLLAAATDESLEWVLSTLRVLVQHVPAAAAQSEAAMTEAVLRVWWTRANDPMAAPCCQEVVAALAAIPACRGAVAGRVTGALRRLLESPGSVEGAPPNIQEAALDMACVVLRKLDPPSAREVHRALFGHAVRLASGSDDAGIVQSAGEVLRLLVLKAGPEFPAWEGTADGASAPHAVLKVLGVLLSPTGDEGAAVFAGNLLSQLLASIPDQIGPMLGDILRVVVHRLATAKMPFFIAGVINALARIAHLACDDLVATLATIPAGDGGTGLELVMRAWTQHQNEVQGSYNIKLTTTALMRVLQCQNPALASVVVNGQLIDTGVIRTRARARSGAAEQWTQVPLSIKILTLLADALAEAAEQGARGDDDGSSGWETESGDGLAGGEGEDDDEWEEEGHHGDLMALLDDAQRRGSDGEDDIVGGGTIFLYGREEGDPIQGLVLADEIRGLVKQLAATRGEEMAAVAQHLTQRQAKVLNDAVTA